MSFASKTKIELAQLSKSRQCCQKAELLGIFLIGAVINNGLIKINTENSAVARRIFSLFKNVFNINGEIKIKRHRDKKSSYYFIASDDKISESLLLESDNKLLKFKINNKLILNECCKKSLLKGLFLGGGSISDPEKNYHFEFTTGHFNLSQDIIDLLSDFDIDAKRVIRKSNFVVYVKESEKIADILNIMGAYKSLMEFHNVKILKDMRNNVNRVVNCETANVSKIVNASFSQIESIKKIKNTVGLKSLPKELLELAVLRLENKEASLCDLGKMLNPPISKSGVNHRLKKIEKIANDII